MLLGALIGLGLPPEELEKILRKVIPVGGWTLKIMRVENGMWPAWSLRVIGDRPMRSPEKMVAAVRRSQLPPAVRRNSLTILSNLQRAEREAHGHAHGQFDSRWIGRIDTLVDIVGCAWGFWRLKIVRPLASSVNTGRLAPASARLFARFKVPVFSDTARLELATPTGTAILTHMVRRFGPMPRLRLVRTGYGAGTQIRDGKPNVLVISQGKTA